MVPNLRYYKIGRLPEPLFFYRECLAGNLPNYLRTQITFRQILRDYGPKLIGARRTRLLLIRSRLKSLVYSLGTGVGVQGHLISARNRALDAEATDVARGICIHPSDASSGTL